MKNSSTVKISNKKINTKVKSIAVQAWLPIVVIIVLMVLTPLWGIFFLPPVTTVFKVFAESWFGARVVTDMLPSLARMIAGLALSILIGVVGGVLLGLNDRLRRMTTPLIEFLRGMPSPALLPFGMVMFGIGDSMKIFIITLVCVFPILLNTVDGVRGLNRTKNMVAAVYRIHGWDRFRLVILPAALPQIFAGVRTSISLALIMIVFSEMLASANGIGHVILIAQRNYDMPEMWAGILLLGTLGYLFNLLFSLIERRLLAWHRASKESKLEQ